MSRCSRPPRPNRFSYPIHDLCFHAPPRKRAMFHYHFLACKLFVGEHLNTRKHDTSTSYFTECASSCLVPPLRGTEREHVLSTLVNDSKYKLHECSLTLLCTPANFKRACSSVLVSSRTCQQGGREPRERLCRSFDRPCKKGVAPPTKARKGRTFCSFVRQRQPRMILCVVLRSRRGFGGAWRLRPRRRLRLARLPLRTPPRPRRWPGRARGPCGR